MVIIVGCSFTAWIGIDSIFIDLHCRLLQKTCLQRDIHSLETRLSTSIWRDFESNQQSENRKLKVGKTGLLRGQIWLVSLVLRCSTYHLHWIIAYYYVGPLVITFDLFEEYWDAYHFSCSTWGERVRITKWKRRFWRGVHVSAWGRQRVISHDIYSEQTSYNINAERKYLNHLTSVRN